MCAQRARRRRRLPSQTFEVGELTQKKKKKKKKKKKAFHSRWNLLLKSQGIFGQLGVIHKSQNEPADWSDRPSRLSLGSTPVETTSGLEALQRLDCCLSAWSAGSECLSSGSVFKGQKEGREEEREPHAVIV